VIPALWTALWQSGDFDEYRPVRRAEPGQVEARVPFDTARFGPSLLARLICNGRMKQRIRSDRGTFTALWDRDT
jgi:hypothetical protein